MSHAISFRPDIQGLRAIAVLSVIIFHLNPAWLPGGFIGVDIFFVISGFLITGILLHKKSVAGSNLVEILKYFYVSRFKRIIPVYLAMLIVVATVSAVMFIPQDFSVFTKSLEKAIWLDSNNYFSSFGDYFAPANYEQPLLHTWSLAVEIQFYLLAPLFILLLPGNILRWVLIGFGLSLIALAEYRMRVWGITQSTYYSLYARLPEFFLGCLAALYIKDVSLDSRISFYLSKFGAILIIFSAIVQPLLGPFPGVLALLPAFGSVLLLTYSAQGWIGNVLRHKALVWIGALSYSLYLWHWPILAFIRYYTGSEILNFNYALLFLILTFTFSIVSYYSIENHFRKEVFNIKAGFILILVACFLFLQVDRVNALFTKEKLPNKYLQYADLNAICHGKIVGDCLRGDINSDKEILVLGDSHAAMLNEFFKYLGMELGVKFRVITASSCVTIPGFDYQRLPEWAQKSCLDQIHSAEEYIKNAKLIFIAGAWDYQFKSKAFLSSMNDFLSKADKENKKIILMAQVPLLNLNPIRSLRFYDLALPIKTSINNKYILANDTLTAMTKNKHHVKVFNLSGQKFFSWAPMYNGQLIYFDNNHLNMVGARLYAEYAEDIFKKVISGD
ncbi:MULTISPECIES: acyltransferase family protein [Plesiomonas]|uniref:WbpC n=1 Tax=Plesiomonas shigelloides TaxID=703 RepID=A0A4D6U7S3_PLESH|nr:acyltransferase family protein [Plesiomonas shigelloides]MCE5164957.1 acyltransferase [Plesiomonas sp. PI-19]MCQ8858400.1 acyltransferase [Plesiomonas shigelloides]QCH03299.1 WbpC [Plesiomonas shigelloides]